MIDTFPMDEEPICDECLMAFWRRLPGQPRRRQARNRSDQAI